MKRVLQYNMESQKLGAYNGIAMERASSPYYHGNIGDMQHMAIPKMQTAHYTHPHVMMQHHMPHQHVAMMPCHTADIYAMHHPAAIMHTYVHGMYHAMPDMYFPLQHPSMYSQPPPPHWPPPNQPPPQYSYPYMQWNVQSPYPVSPHYFGYKAAEPIIQEVEAHEQDAAVRLEGFSAVTEPSGPSAIEAVTEFEVSYVG